MPAPQASMMQQFARTKFMGFGLTVPTDWKHPSGDPQGKHYDDAFTPSEKATAPAVPPLVKPASLNKYHTDTQKMHVQKIGAFIDGICSAICSAWGQWQTATTMVGVVINGPAATGGQLIGPPLMPLIMASAPKASPNETKYSTAVASAINTGWLAFTATVKVAGMPWYPAFAMVPAPVAPPVPNVPVPFAALTQVPTSISANSLKGLMVANLGDPMAPFHKELFEAISFAFEQCYNLWKVSTMVTNVIGTGPVPTFAPPYVPGGPVVAGFGTMTPGGLA